MLTKRMFWTAVAAATAAAGVISWLMIRATQDYPHKLAPAIPPTESIASPVPGPPQPADGTVGKAVGLHLRAAIDAIKRQDFAYAQSFLMQAEAVPNKSPFETFKISETWAYLYGQQKNYKGLLKTHETMLANPGNRQFLTTEQAATMAKLLPQLALAAQDYPKAIEHSQRWIVDHPGDSGMTALLAQAYDLSGNYQECRNSLRTAINAAEHANTKPLEHWMVTLLSCANNLGDTTSVEWAYERLCRHYPKPEYWKHYIRIVSRSNQADLARFYTTRLELDAVGSLDPIDYTHLAQEELMDYGLPANAARTLQQALAQHAFDSTPRSMPRVQRTLELATEAAAASLSSIPALISAFSAAPTSQNGLALGLVYFDNEQYPDAIKMLSQTLEKGPIKDPGHARMTLAIAHLKNGNREAARTVFTLAASDQALERVAHAWIVRSYN